MKTLRKIMLPIIILALFSTVFFTLPNNYEVKHQHQKSYSVCLTLAKYFDKTIDINEITKIEIDEDLIDSVKEDD